MRTLILLALFVTPAGLIADTPKPKTGPWDMPALQAVEVKPTWGEADGLVRPVYYPGEPYRGKPTRVFAYYGRPKGDGPFPAVVLVHGGGGKAFAAWAKHWAERGYCALAMDLAGHGPDGKLPDGGPDQSDTAKFGEFDDDTVRDMWTYHAIAAVVRGHNLIRSRPEVDAERVAVTGISWGGYLTCIVAGLDHRFKAAVPVYGCGFLHENSVWKPKLDGFSKARRDRWVGNFDPSRYLPGVTCPILFVNGTNDFAYPLDSYQKCYSLVCGPRMLSVQVRLRHGHIWTFGEVDAFVDSHLTGGKPLPTIGEMTTKGETVSAPVSGKTVLVSGQLHYAVAVGPWQSREWKSTPATLADGRVSAPLPADRPLVYYLTVTDARKLIVSAPHQILEQ